MILGGFYFKIQLFLIYLYYLIYAKLSEVPEVSWCSGLCVWFLSSILLMSSTPYNGYLQTNNRDLQYIVFVMQELRVYVHNICFF